MIITIDGPAASGKSTVARMLADRLEMCHISTGMFYRALAYLLLHEKKYKLETLANAHEADIVEVLDPKRFTAQYSPGTQLTITFDGRDITSFLKNAEIDKGASIIGTSAIARKHLLGIQQDCGCRFDVVAEGRDTGSVIFPDADIKFYLTASDEVRALRMQADAHKRGNDISVQEALDALKERDARDRERNVAPLTIPENAEIVDNSDMDIEQTVQAMLNIVKQHGL